MFKSLICIFKVKSSESTVYVGKIVNEILVGHERDFATVK